MADPKVHTTSEQAKALQKMDSDGGVLGDSPSDVMSVEEMSVRSSHQGEGGGAWPPHLLRQFIDPIQPGALMDVEVAGASEEKAPVKK
jgi:hypothetical protein